MKTINVPFSFTGSGDVGSTSNLENIVKQQVIDFFSTSVGERIQNYRYGGNIRSMAFELLDSLVFADYKMDALAEVNRHLSKGKVTDIRVAPKDVAFGGYDEESTITITVNYSITPSRVSTIKLLVTGTKLTEESDL